MAKKAFTTLKEVVGIVAAAVLTIGITSGPTIVAAMHHAA